MKNFKRFLAAFLVALTVLSCNVTGFAATKPSITFVRKSASTVKRGKTAKFYYKVSSGSYTKKSGKYRAFYGVNMRYKSPKGAAVWSDCWLFTGKSPVLYDYYTFGRNQKTGKYFWVGYTYYHKNGTSSVSTAVKTISRWTLSDYSYASVVVK